LSLCFEDAPKEQDERELERVLAAATDYEHMSEYERLLLQAFYVIYAKAKNKEKLVHLLLAKCVQFLATQLRSMSKDVRGPLHK